MKKKGTSILMKNMALLIDTNIILDWILKRCPFIDCGTILKALDAVDFDDLEDSLQMLCANVKELDYIITRDNVI